MNNNVNPLLAFTIIVVFGGLIGLKFYFYGLALDVPKVQYLKKSPAGSLYIRLGSRLYDYSADGFLNRVIDLKLLGISGNFGDFDFFSNGDLLINRDDFLPTLEDKLDNYARRENTKIQVAEAGKGLQRCNLSQLICEAFNRDIPALQGAYFLHIDRQQNDDVYLADALRHEVRKFNQAGDLLAELKSGLKFPNQIYREGNKLWIVDTNHHVMKAVNSDTENFGEAIEKHETVLEGGWIWPSAFSRVDDAWWINISDNAMQNARVVIFDHSWEKGITLNLPDNADPIASAVIGNSVVIVDALQYALYRFNFQGHRKTDFAKNSSSQGIQFVLQENKAQDRKYRLWSDLSLWLGIGLFIPLFGFAVIMAIKDSSKEKAEKAAETPESKARKLASLPQNGDWVEAKPKMRYLKWLVFALVICSMILFAFASVLLKIEIPLELIVMTLSIPMLSLFLVIPAIKISQYKIGFFKDQITLLTHTGKHISKPYDEIKWTSRMFTVGQWCIPMGNTKQGIFPYDKFQERLLPHVSPSNKLGPFEALKLQWKSPERALRYNFLVAILASVLYIFFIDHN